ncbi:hypothetical protein FGO68_gene6869 [Halteria grandinella]|uniref:Uncharacterized protein n=1 Tax=Halteria grandinella TaxID=5974 RepID=A0A8J8T7U7_HALGN|nr:hypothetical protein FGO68_gene6869 [Halteria grandinella]
MTKQYAAAVPQTKQLKVPTSQVVNVTFNGADKTSAVNTSIEGSPSVLGIGSANQSQQNECSDDESGEESGMNHKPMSIALQSFGGVSQQERNSITYGANFTPFNIDSLVQAKRNLFAKSSSSSSLLNGMIFSTSSPGFGGGGPGNRSLDMKRNSVMVMGRRPSYFQMKESSILNFDADEVLHRGTDFMIGYDGLKLRAQEHRQMDLELLDGPQTKDEQGEEFFRISMLMNQNPFDRLMILKGYERKSISALSPSKLFILSSSAALQAKSTETKTNNLMKTAHSGSGVRVTFDNLNEDQKEDLKETQSDSSKDSLQRKSSQLGLMKDMKSQSALMMTSFYRLGTNGNAMGNVIAEEEFEDDEGVSSSSKEE